jgi:hypothetical protein
MSWLLVLASTWMALALVLGSGIGRAIRVADQRQASDTSVAGPDFVPDEWTAFPTASR